MKFGFVIMLVVIFSVNPSVHPLHVSVTEIAFDEKEKELEIVMRIFVDDLESAVRNQLNEPELNLLTPKTSTTDKLVREYLQPRMSVSLDGKKQIIKYLGHEMDEEALTLYIQVQPVKKWQSIDVTNSIITELHDDQSNIINVTRNEKTKSLRLMKDNPTGKLTFDIK